MGRIGRLASARRDLVGRLVELVELLPVEHPREPLLLLLPELPLPRELLSSPWMMTPVPAAGPVSREGGSEASSGGTPTGSSGGTPTGSLEGIPAVLWDNVAEQPASFSSSRFPL